MVELAVALQKPVAARMLVREARNRDVRGIVERTPDVLAAAGPHRKPIGIVDFRPPIDGSLLDRLGIPVHRGQRREPEPLHGLAEEQRLLDVHDDALRALHDEAVGACHARAVEQRIHGDASRGRRGGQEPEGHEIREIPRAWRFRGSARCLAPTSPPGQARPWPGNRTRQETSPRARPRASPRFRLSARAARSPRNGTGSRAGARPRFPTGS